MILIQDKHISVLLSIIKMSLWGGSSISIDRDVYNELKAQAIVAIPYNVFPHINASDELKNIWKNDILYTISYNTRYRYIQDNLPITTPYVILKGTAAAQYYPFPQCRTMGDIDIMTRREDYSCACNMLLENGYKDITDNHTEGFGRHKCFSKNGILVEVHAFFALLNDPKKAEWLDNTIVENINSTHILPDLINGLVLLEHIDQHMEAGLGLRQVIDWMMFVDKCLDNRAWIEFQKMAQRIGLEQLALITTRMCEIYLGLSQHEWCQNIDVNLCDRLMEYILSCGNFGIKHNDDKHARVQVLTYTRTPLAVLRHMQERGRNNWEAAQKHSVLRGFAWLYQICQYIKKGACRSYSNNILSEYDAAKDRIALFDALGTTQSSKGYAIYKDGKYIKTYKKP